MLFNNVRLNNLLLIHVINEIYMLQSTIDNKCITISSNTRIKIYFEIERQTKILIFKLAPFQVQNRFIWLR